MSKFHGSSIVLSVACACMLALGCASSDVPSAEPPTSAAPPQGDQGTPAPEEPQAAAPAEPGDTVLGDPGNEAASEGGCAGLAAAACSATEGCQVVRGARVVAKPGAAGAAAAHCLQPMTEIACIPAQMCAQVMSYFCNDAGEVYQVSSACGPASWKSCPAPQQLQGACAP